MSIIAFLKARATENTRANILYLDLAQQARHPKFYAPPFHIPDTIDGRFELLVLHLFCVLTALRNTGQKRLVHKVYNSCIKHLDMAVRLQGVSDFGVGPKLNTMTRAIGGRLIAYGKNLPHHLSLQNALNRNLYGTCTPPNTTASLLYLQQALSLMETQLNNATIAASPLKWPSP